MLRINRKTDYAVRIVLALAKHSPKEHIATRKFQESMLIPKAFLQRIIADLSRVGLIQTDSGPNCGLRLRKDLQDISLFDILKAIDKPILLSDCLLDPGVCSLDVSCPVRSH